MNGVLTISSVDPVTGEEFASGEMVRPGGRGAIAFRAARGESLLALAPALARRIAEHLRALDAKDAWPVVARFDVREEIETLVHVEPAMLSPNALVRVLVERARDGRLTRDQALGRLTPETLTPSGTFELAAPPSSPPIARGLAASAGAASGRLALPDDFATEPTDPFVVVVDDAAPEDAAALRSATAIVATSGGLTADAAIAARALRKPCVVSANLRPGSRDQPARGDWVTVDGTAGLVYMGALPTRWSPTTPFGAAVLSWIDPAPGETVVGALLRAQKSMGQGHGR